jgi:hypothetical protein
MNLPENNYSILMVGYSIAFPKIVIQTEIPGSKEKFA